MERGFATGSRRAAGFTFIELLVVLALLALLASIAMPMLTSSVSRAREATLKEDLQVIRKAIDDYYGDRGEYPPSLAALVERRYLRRIPVDPFTDRSDSWRLVTSDTDRGGLMDVHTGSDQPADDGGFLRDW